MRDVVAEAYKDIEDRLFAWLDQLDTSLIKSDKTIVVSDESVKLLQTTYYQHAYANGFLSKQFKKTYDLTHDEVKALHTELVGLQSRMGITKIKRVTCSANFKLSINPQTFLEFKRNIRKDISLELGQTDITSSSNEKEVLTPIDESIETSTALEYSSGVISELLKSLSEGYLSNSDSVSTSSSFSSPEATRPPDYLEIEPSLTEEKCEQLKISGHEQTQSTEGQLGNKLSLIIQTPPAATAPSSAFFQSSQPPREKRKYVKNDWEEITRNMHLLPDPSDPQKHHIRLDFNYIAKEKVNDIIHSRIVHSIRASAFQLYNRPAIEATVSTSKDYRWITIPGFTKDQVQVLWSATLAALTQNRRSATQPSSKRAKR